MPSSHPFRFGTGLQGTTWPEFAAHMRRAEDLGYSSVSVTDHVSQARLAPLSTLGALATLDSPLRLTTAVLGNDFRHPAILASEAATVDVISNGRLELGIGTGWLDTDYDQTGIPFDSPGTRVSRLTEAVHVLKSLFSDQPVTFEGDHYSIHDLNLLPKPVQKPHPRLLIGGGGKRMLSLAAREADIVSINPTSRDGGMDFQTMLPDAFAQKVDWVRTAAGERLPALELHALLFAVQVTDDPLTVAEQWLNRMSGLSVSSRPITPEEYLASPHVLIGTIDQMVDKLHASRELYGLSYIATASYINMEVLAPVIAQLAGR